MNQASLHDVMHPHGNVDHVLDELIHTTLIFLSYIRKQYYDDYTFVKPSVYESNFTLNSQSNNFSSRHLVDTAIQAMAIL